jgi:hypothetical protein
MDKAILLGSVTHAEVIQLREWGYHVKVEKEYDTVSDIKVYLIMDTFPLLKALRANLAVPEITVDKAINEWGNYVEDYKGFHIRITRNTDQYLLIQIFEICVNHPYKEIKHTLQFKKNTSNTTVAIACKTLVESLPYA